MTTSPKLNLMPASILRELLDYDPETGVFRWKVNPGTQPRIGTVAGYIASNGYSYIRIRGKMYLAHRLAVAWMRGEWPAGELDHIDGNPANNRFVNLRDASRYQNMANIRRRTKNVAGYRGVSLHKKSGLWHARIRSHGRFYHLGYFHNSEDAARAYDVAALRLNGEFALTNKLLGMISSNSEIEAAA